MADLTLTWPLDKPTPVQELNGRWYKRDDLLAFSNGVNGKVRTTLYLAEQAKAAGAAALIYGGSVKAPALGRVASGAAYAGMDCFLVVGSKKAAEHPAVAVAVEAGAQLITSPVAYNTALQARARKITTESGGYVAQVAYGVSTPPDATAEEVRGFLEQDASQVTNLPDEVETLVVPFGSGNAACGIFYGLAMEGPPQNLRRVILIGVGPDRRAWFTDRLKFAGVPLDHADFDVEFDTTFPDFAVYADQMPESVDGINFHPTYEGKIVRYLNAHPSPPSWWTDRSGKTCFWIVGGPL